jgi:group I intron endonuclease
MSLENEWIVYAHINKVNGKMYVGITSQEVQKRWGYGAGYSESPYFNNAINKYGWNNFDHEIIAEHLTEKEAKNFEKRLIKELQLRNDRFGYNLTNGGDGISGYKHTKETKEKLRNISLNMSEETKRKMVLHKLGVPLTEEHKKNISKGDFNKGIKPIVQYNINGVFIKKWDSLKDASNELEIQISDISSCCHGNKKSAGGFMWRFYNGNISNIESYSTKHKIVLQFDINNNFVKEWNSLNDIALYLNISNAGNISSVCNGKRDKAYGYIWRYKEEVA